LESQEKSESAGLVSSVPHQITLGRYLCVALFYYVVVVALFYY